MVLAVYMSRMHSTYSRFLVAGFVQSTPCQIWFHSSQAFSDITRHKVPRSTLDVLNFLRFD